MYKDIERQHEYGRNYHWNHREEQNKKASELFHNRYHSDPDFRKRTNERTRIYGRKTRLLALQMVSKMEKPACICGCDDLRVLEINHKNGGGRQEYKKFGLTGHRLHRAIVTGKRKVDDLNVRCRVCNAIHDVERRFGFKYRVEFIGETRRNFVVGDFNDWFGDIS